MAWAASAAPFLNLAGTLYSANKGSKAQKKGEQALTQNLDWVKNLMPKQWQVSSPVGGMNITPGGVSSSFYSPFRQSLMSTPGMFDNAYWNAGQLMNAANQYLPYEQQQAALATDWRNLRDKVAPGYSQLGEVRRTALGDAHTQRMSNLRNAIAGRRLAGSSFGNQALGTAEADYGRALADTESKTFLEELAATQQIYQGEAAQAAAAANMLANRLATIGSGIGMQTDAARGKGQVTAAGLDADLRLLAESMGGMRNMMDFIANMSQVITGNATSLGELSTSSAQGWGSLAGQLLPNIMPKQNPYTGAWSNPWQTT